MKRIHASLMSLLLLPVGIRAETLCFSPVKEKSGDRSSSRSPWQPFDYKVQVDGGPIVKPAAEKSTPYPVSSASPLVKIWLGSRVVESFRISRDMLTEGRNCIYFKNLYETWSIVEGWQVKKLCSCGSSEKDNKPLQPIARENARSG